MPNKQVSDIRFRMPYGHVILPKSFIDADGDCEVWDSE
jgi:hypothetical protein